MKLLRNLGPLACLLVLTLAGPNPASADTMYANDELACGDSLYSSNGWYRLFCTEISGPPAYTTLAWRYVGPGSSQTLWTARHDSLASGLGTHTDQWSVVDDDAIAVMQGDGNFVLYNHSLTTSVWATFTNGNSNAFLNLQDDGNLVVYTSSSVPIWSVF